MHIQFKKEWTVPSVVGIVTAALGFGGGYILAKKRYQFVEYISEVEEVEEVESEPGNSQLQLDFDRRMDEAFSEIKNLKEILDPNFPVKRNLDVPREVSMELPAPDPESIEVNVFRNEDEEWNWDEEIQKRESSSDAGTPYVIHRDEFFDEETDYRQSTLTYYSGDDILCDDQDVPVYNAHTIVGEMLFGHGSKDPNVVYIRNNTLQAEYEILKSTGHYQIEVLGAEIEKDLSSDDGLSHSIRKFKLD